MIFHEISLLPLISNRKKFCLTTWLIRLESSLGLMRLLSLSNYSNNNTGYAVHRLNLESKDMLWRHSFTWPNSQSIAITLNLFDRTFFSSGSVARGGRTGDSQTKGCGFESCRRQTVFRCKTFKMSSNSHRLVATPIAGINCWLTDFLGLTSKRSPSDA